jgi:hypothetical protein
MNNFKKWSKLPQFTVAYKLIYFNKTFRENLKYGKINLKKVQVKGMVCHIQIKGMVYSWTGKLIMIT